MVTMRNNLIIKVFSICLLLILQNTTWAQNEKEFYDGKCSSLTTVEPIIVAMSDIICNNYVLPPVNGSLPNGEYIFEVNYKIEAINHNGVIDKNVLEHGDSVIVVAFTYDLETINIILNLFNDIVCQQDYPNPCDGIAPGFGDAIEMFVSGENDGVPGIGGLQEILDFVDFAGVPDIVSVSDAIIRLISVNDFLGSIGIFTDNGLLICYAGSTICGVYFDLPIELESFTALSDKCNINLTWQTASERNFSHFEIQKSHNGIDFYNIGRVASINSEDSDGGIYNYTDNEELKAMNYYRLKSVDKDHTFSYSDVIVVKSECTDGGTPTVNISPNPVKGDFLSIQLVAPTSMDNVKIYITDQLGRTVAEQYVSVTEGFNQLEINVNQLNAHAIYFLNIQSAEWHTTTQRFVKR